MMVFLLSCNKDCCTIIDTTVDIEYNDSSGADLFKVDTNFRADEIKIYYKTPIGYTYMSNPDRSIPKLYEIDTIAGRTIIRLEPSFYYSGSRSTTLIELNERTIDTLVGDFEFKGSSTYIAKVWYNGVLSPSRYLRVSK